MYEIIPVACVIITAVMMYFWVNAEFSLQCRDHGYIAASITIDGVKCTDGDRSAFLRELHCFECYYEEAPEPLEERQI